MSNCNSSSNVTEPPKGHGGKKIFWLKKIYLKAERKIIIWFARYRKPTSGSEYIFRVRGKTNDRNDEALEIIVYFELGRKYSDIKSILASRHAFHISERHLKRILRDHRGHSPQGVL
jgi:AraC-like DNA-binding protein